MRQGDKPETLSCGLFESPVLVPTGLLDPLVPNQDHQRIGGCDKFEDLSGGAADPVTG